MHRIEALTAAIENLTVALYAVGGAKAPETPKEAPPAPKPEKAAPAPKVADTQPTAPATPAAPAKSAPASVVGFDALKGAFLDLCEKDMPAGQAILAGMKVGKLSGLKPEQYADAMAKVTAANG